MPTERDCQRMLRRAKALCEAQQIQFTVQRQQLFELLLKAEAPLSAYELLDLYQSRHKPDAQPMTVYRGLDFLLAAGLVHKIDSRSKFMVCEHLICDHDHGMPEFLICDDCGQVVEAAVPNKQLQLMRLTAERHGFTLKSHQLELHGLCDGCIGREDRHSI
jgi:Fur family zinc uptake transcriptional regulator